jgi:hypothetical protein
MGPAPLALGWRVDKEGWRGWLAAGGRDVGRFRRRAQGRACRERGRGHRSAAPIPFRFLPAAERALEKSGLRSDRSSSCRSKGPRSTVSKGNSFRPVRSREHPCPLPPISRRRWAGQLVRRPQVRSARSEIWSSQTSHPGPRRGRVLRWQSDCRPRKRKKHPGGWCASFVPPPKCVFWGYCFEKRPPALPIPGEPFQTEGTRVSF